MHTSRLALSLGSLLLLTSTADAQVLKCKDASGNVTYTQMQCPTGTRPLDVPDSVTREVGSARPSSAGTQRLSARAEALGKQVDACRKSYRDSSCLEFIDLRQRCMQNADRTSPDCAALDELAIARNMERIPEIPRGDGSASKDQVSAEAKVSADIPRTIAVSAETVACSPNMLFEGSHESIRGCARSQSLPNTPRWAQVKDFPNPNGPGTKWTGHYICLRFIEFPKAEGGSGRVRPYLTVRQEQTEPGAPVGFTLGNLRYQKTFPTKQAAVEFGCALDE